MNSVGRARIAALIFTLCAQAGLSSAIFARPQQDTMAVQLTPEELEHAKQTFETTCSTCHGLDGGGAMGPNIQGIPFRLGVDAVANVIKNGMAGGMPAFSSQLDTKQIQQLVGYLLTLSRKDTGTVTGDAAKGKDVYNSAGCSGCHIVSGAGSGVGPELTDVGQLRGAGYLRNAVLYPGTDLPQERVFLETGGRLQYLYVHVVAKDGRAVDGTRVIEDSFHIVLKDANGKFHSFRKDELRELKKEAGKSSMPSVKGKLSDAQVNDLVAYLASLKGAQ